MAIHLFILTGFAAPLFAQPKLPAIHGKVMDSAKKPVDYATISLLKAQDSSLIKVVFSDERGTYAFDNIKNGQYIVKASMIGFPDVRSEVINLSSENMELYIEDLIMSLRATSLQEVMVTGQRPLIERKADMLVVNVANSPLAAGNNALDILERSPGIAVDKDDHISLNGKQGVMVMIDGKPSHLSPAQLAGLLRSTNGNTIQSIEIITNPSAKYDAQGTAGIINITLKKNTQVGTNANLSLSAGYGKTHKANTSLSLNHRAGRISTFGTYSYLNDKGERSLDIYRIVGAEANLTNFDQLTAMDQQRHSHSIRTGIAYYTSDKNTLSVELSGDFINSIDDNVSNTFIGSQASTIDSTLRSENKMDGHFNSFAINFNDIFLMDTLGRKLSTEIDISRFEDNNATGYANFLYDVKGTLMRNPLIMRSGMPSLIQIQSAKIDYVHPLNKGSKLEAGLKFAQVTTDNDMKFERQNNDRWENMPERTNHFVYDERVAAMYINYHLTIGKLTGQAGLRSEYTFSDGNSITLQNRVQREYVDFFPAISLQYNASDTHKIGLTYNKRISRPNYSNLNPFLYFLDEYTYQRGNPYLQPAYTHSFGLNYTLLNKFNFSLGYDLTNDAMTEVMEQDDLKKTTTVYQDNFASSQNWYININAPFNFAKFWESNTDISAFYLGFKTETLDFPVNNGQFAFQFTNNHTFTLTPSLKAEITGNYRSSLTYSIYKIGQQWSIDAGLNQSFMNKKANLKLAVSDLFDSRTHYVTTHYANLNAVIDSKWETRVVRLTLSYAFGNSKIKASKRDIGSEEKARVGNN